MNDLQRNTAHEFFVLGQSDGRLFLVEFAFNQAFDFHQRL